MKDFDNVDRYYPSEVLTDRWEMGSMDKHESGDYVSYEDYQELLEEYKFISDQHNEDWLFFTIINEFMIKHGILEITHEGGAKEAAMNVCDSIMKILEEYKKLLYRMEGLDK